MTILVGKRELHFAPIDNSEITINMKSVGFAIIHQNDELIDVIDNKYVSDMVNQIKSYEPKANIRRIER